MTKPGRSGEPLPRPYPGALRIGPEEEEGAVAAVREVLRSKRLYRGGGVPDARVASRVDAFEEGFARAIGAEHTIAMNSGTSALVSALAAIGVGPGDEVIVPAYTWISTATSVLAVGAVPVVADVDDSLTLDPDAVKASLSPYTRAIMPVHMRGAPAAMDRLCEIARPAGALVVEDVAQAVGATYRGRRLGTFGDAGAFSFQMSKIITAGEGGMMVTDSTDIARRAMMYHDAASIDNSDVSAEEWMPGVNLRMSELHAAILLVQLQRLDRLLADMRSRKERLKQMIEAPLRAHGVGFRRLHDPGGDAGLAIILLFSDPGRASRFASVVARGGCPAFQLYNRESTHVHAHVYRDWAPLLERRAWSASGAPWNSHPRRVDYPRDACAKSIGLLERAVNIEITPDYTDQQLEQMAGVITDAVEALD